MKNFSIILWCCFLAVSYAADMIKTSADETNGMIVLQSSDDLVLKCTATNQAADIDVTWKHSAGGSEPKAVTLDDRISVETAAEEGKPSSTLTIRKPTEKDAGNYTCVFNISGASQLVTENIHVVTNVTVRMTSKSINKQEGDDLTIPCKVFGKPTPGVTWTKDGQDVFRINNASHRLSLSANEDDVPDAKLALKELARPEDAGDYCCRAENVANAAEQCIIIRVKDKYAALWPFIGIVAEVVLLTAIIYIYEKKKSKPDMDDSDTDHANDRPEPKGDVRQRK